MALHAEIKEMIARIVAVEEEEVREAAHLQEDLGADSLALLDLAEAIGERYRVEIEADDLVGMENVGALVSMVRARIASSD